MQMVHATVEVAMLRNDDHLLFWKILVHRVPPPMLPCFRRMILAVTEVTGMVLEVARIPLEIVSGKNDRRFNGCLLGRCRSCERKSGDATPRGQEGEEGHTEKSKEDKRTKRRRGEKCGKGTQCNARNRACREATMDL